ncbi:2-5A-dependent ribonuclease-like [Hemicordylus capensis]|uniref:2-5A-dependent ribonuclease-like n=1 Tax=Hemicordylus capensis TaxID=884348 RepID=UPI00230314EA|nr:2-5A-dependent ribonuclease-like [Hemicordylus capensis]
MFNYLSLIYKSMEGINIVGLFGKPVELPPSGELRYLSSWKMAAEALYNAVQNGSIEGIQKLLEDGVDINSKVNNHGFTALHCAVCDNKEEIVSFLLEKGADPRARKDNGATPFITAGITGNVRLLELLLDSRERINEYDFNGFTALMEAAWHGKEEALKFLSGCGADVNFARVVDKEKRALNRGGRTALMDAAENGHVAVVKALVEEMEAVVNICDNKDRNALVHALSMTKNKNWDQDKEAIALFLLQHGAVVNKKDASERTTLILAVENQSQKLVKALLEKEQVDINAADKNGRTALMVATEKKNWDIAKTLCEKGARTDIGDPIGIACRTYHLEMVKLLQQYGAMASSSQPQKHWTPVSKHWGPKLQELYGKSCVAIGKLRIYKANCDFRFLETSQGGVYLGFYDEKEVAVKIFKSESANAKCEKTCLEKCRTTSKYLVKFYGSEEENACLYICLSLCEKNLEEYLKTSNHATLKSEDILPTVFQAVQELHTFGFGHQDLHPRNILIGLYSLEFGCQIQSTWESTPCTPVQTP